MAIKKKGMFGSVDITDTGEWSYTNCPSCAALRGEVEKLRGECSWQKERNDNNVLAYSERVKELESALSRYREAVEWQLSLPQMWDGHHAELNRRAGEG